jgi:hypothetical protein
MGTLYFGFVLGLVAWFRVRHPAAGFCTVILNQRAMQTRFGRVNRVGDAFTLIPRNSELLGQPVAATQAPKGATN